MPRAGRQHRAAHHEALRPGGALVDQELHAACRPSPRPRAGPARAEPRRSSCGTAPPSRPSLPSGDTPRGRSRRSPGRRSCELRAALSISLAAAQVGNRIPSRRASSCASTRSFCWSSTSANTSVSSHEQRRAVADHRRRDHALQHRVDDRRPVDARLLDQRDALGERGHGDHEREVDRDLREDRLAVRPDVGDLRADRPQRSPRCDRTPARSPPTITDIWPAASVAGLPDTGQSRKEAPVARTRSASATLASGEIVLMSAHTVPSRRPAEHAVLAVRGGLDRGGVREHREQHVDRLRQLARRVRPAHPGRRAAAPPSRCVRFQPTTS